MIIKVEVFSIDSLEKIREELCALYGEEVSKHIQFIEKFFDNNEFLCIEFDTQNQTTKLKVLNGHG